MKFVMFIMNDVAKMADVAAASDKTMASPPPGTKLLARYVCLGIPFPGAPPNTLVVISLREAESAEGMAAISYPLALAGATVWYVPVLEVPVEPRVAEVEEKYRGLKRAKR